MFFLRNRLYLRRAVVTSFCMQFKKLGRGLLREARRSEGEERGVKKKVSVLENGGEHSSTNSNKNKCSAAKILENVFYSFNILLVLVLVKLLIFHLFLVTLTYLLYFSQSLLYQLGRILML